MSTYTIECPKCLEIQDITLPYRLLQKLDFWCEKDGVKARRKYYPPYIPTSMTFDDPYDGTYSTALGRVTKNRTDFQEACKQQGLSLLGTDLSAEVRDRREEAFDEEGKPPPKIDWRGDRWPSA